VSFFVARCGGNINYGAQRFRQINSTEADGLAGRPTSGSIIFDGKDVSSLPEGARAKLRLGYLGYVFQEYALLGELTTLQNVYLPGMMLNGAR